MANGLQFLWIPSPLLRDMDKSRNFIRFRVIAVLSWEFWQSEDFMQLAAGVALFMFGMLAFEQGFQAFTGGVLEPVLASAWSRRPRCSPVPCSR